MPQRRNVVLDSIQNAIRMASIIQQGRAQQQAQAVREQQLADTQRIKENDRIRQTQLDEDKRQKEAKTDARNKKTDARAERDERITSIKGGAVPVGADLIGQMEAHEQGERLTSPGTAVLPGLPDISTGIPAPLADLGSGVNTPIERGRLANIDDTDLFFPPQAAFAQRDLAQKLDETTRVEGAKNKAKRREPKFQAFTGDSGEVTVADLTTGQKKSLGKIGKGTAKATAKGESRAQARLEKKDEKDAFIAAEASRIYLENGGDADRAIDDIPRQASFDDTGRFSKNAVAIAKFIKTLKESPDKALETLRIIFGDNIPPELLSGGQPGAASPAGGGSAAGAQEEARRFLQRRRK